MRRQLFTMEAVGPRAARRSGAEGSPSLRTAFFRVLSLGLISAVIGTILAVVPMTATIVSGHGQRAFASGIQDLSVWVGYADTFHGTGSLPSP